jgi:hypothetical protein
MQDSYTLTVFELSMRWMTARVSELTRLKSSSVYNVATFSSCGTLFFSREDIQGLSCNFLVTTDFKAFSISSAAYSAVVLSAVIRKMLCC